MKNKISDIKQNKEPYEDKVLNEILKIREDRRSSYGSPSISFNSIANLWNIFLESKNIKLEDKKKLVGSDIAIMMNLLKISRMITSENKSSPNYLDSYVDAANYISLAYQLFEEEQK